ncbi:MAG: cation diffusion facilitator family transporter, partial [Desulfobulbaceae bacterium]|nr:cation diffusion facilitator family transporter [Desulfobulbaceae bacterium]
MNEPSATSAASKRRRQSMLAVQVGLAANILLAVLKCTVGILGASPALLADGINSTSDVAYGVVVSIFVRLSAKPADHEHPYGHDQLESVAAVVVGAFVITTAIAIFWHTVATVHELLTAPAEEGGTGSLALWVALSVVLVKFGLTVWTYGISRRVKNSAVLA